MSKNTIVYTGNFNQNSINKARTTESVLKEEIKNAKKEILILTYLISGGAKYILDLLEKKSGNVEINLIFSDKNDDLKLEMVNLMKDYASIKFKKIKNEDYENFHPKCIIFDQKKAYIGSANLTEPATKGKNIEIGVLIQEDKSSVNTLREMFQFLWKKAKDIS